MSSTDQIKTAERGLAAVERAKEKQKRSKATAHC